MSRAPTYDIGEILGEDKQSFTPSPAWAICVVRLGLPLSYSRKDLQSVSTDVSEGAKLRGPNLIIASDCFSLVVSGSKDSHIKTMSAELRQTDHNYLTEILPGDWVLAWMVDWQDELETLLDKIRREEACNSFHDGLKFVGRVESIRKRVNLDRERGTKTTSVTVAASGFKELDTQFFYDPLLAQADETLGTWLARIGIDVGEMFDVDVKTGQKNNSAAILRTLLNLLLGKGVDSGRVNAASKQYTAAGGNPNSLQATAGGGTISGGENAPYAYLVPKVVGKLLGVSEAKNAQVSKPGGLLSFCDLLEVVIGVQSFENKDAEEVGKRFKPTLKELLGTYLPVMPQFTNTPLWSLLQQFVNPAVNEMYTVLRVNEDDLVVPTLVVRQIPSTDAIKFKSDDSFGPKEADVAVTKHLDVPRWVLPSVLVHHADVGRSDATRFNFVHVYGQDANLAETVTFTQQLVLNPPVRDDLDIQRSGLRPYLSSVACSIKDQVGHTPGTWIALVADRLIGSQYTLNGTVGSLGISAPIAEGDNLEWEGVVYQIESVTHQCVQSGRSRTFSTTLSLTNGYRAEQDGRTAGDGGSEDGGASFPIYPGLLAEDNTEFDPGISVDDRFDRTDPTVGDGDLADRDKKPQKAGSQRFTKPGGENSR